MNVYKSIGIIVVIGVCVGLFAVTRNLFAPEDVTCSVDHPSLERMKNMSIAPIELDGVVYQAWVAMDVFAQHKGLSDTYCLPEGYAMLFDFGTPAVQKFWMKDMNYPIDIVWLDENKREIGRVVGADPKGYHQRPPVTYSSQVPVRYVLEIPSTKK
jgi:uncharacterized membrane protein (UPF0127 family)